MTFALDISSTAIAGEVVPQGPEGVQRVCAAQENLLLNVHVIAYFEGADAPYPLRAVAHLPRFAVEEERRRFAS